MTIDPRKRKSVRNQRKKVEGPDSDNSAAGRNMLTCIIMNQETKGKEMAPKSLLKSESAAAIAIAAVLLLGLAFTIVSVVKLNYVPEWKIDEERDYSYDAWTSMEDVKNRADIFARFMALDRNYPEYGLSATIPLRMGGGEVPVFEPSKSNSKLAVNNEKCIMIVTLSKHPNAPLSIDCGGITYYSENRQYPDQVFRYENGALILAQGNNSQMKRTPSFNIEETIGGNYTVTINAINLTGETASISSSTFTALRLTGDSINPRLNSNDNNESVDSFNLSISTRYTDAWVAYFNDTAKEEGLVYNTDYTIEFIPNDYVCISFNLPGKLDGLYVNETVICAELGKGGVIPSGFVPSGDGKINMAIPGLYYFETFTGKITDNKNIVTIINPSPNPGLLKDKDADYALPSNSQVLPSYENLNAFSENLGENEVIELNLSFKNYKAFEPQPSNATVRMIYSFSNKNQNPIINVELSGNNSGNFYPNNDEWYLYQETFPVSVTDPENLILKIKVTSPNQNVKGTFSIDYVDVYLN